MKYLTLFSLAVIVVCTACKTEKKEHIKTDKKITMGMVDGWAEGVAMTYLAKEILTREGYNVKLKRVAVDLIFASLNSGDTDIFMDVWLPVTHGKKLAKFPDLISLGESYSNVKIGLVVPSYAEINSIEELNINKDKFDGKIMGIEKGAGLTAVTNKAIEKYDLKLEQLNSSTIAMLSELQKAINENRWIAIVGWMPHWKFGRFDLKFLEDPKKIYGETERIETYARKGFKEDDKFATNFFANVNLDDATMLDLIFKMEKDNKDEVAKQWIKDHQKTVNTWLGKTGK